MGEVRSPGQGLQLVMPEWQPWVADHLAPGMSTSLGPPFTLYYNDKKASHLDVDFIIHTPHPTLNAMGWLSWVPCIAKVMGANNLKSPLVQAVAWCRRHESLLTNINGAIRRQWIKTSKKNQLQFHQNHYSDIIMSAMASQITGVSIVCLAICWGTGQRKCQNSVSLALVRGIHQWPVDSPHKGPRNTENVSICLTGILILSTFGFWLGNLKCYT